MIRAAISLFAVIAFTPVVSAQVTLAEAPAGGDCFRYTVELDLTGKMYVTQAGTKEAIRLHARARHLFVERTLATADGLPVRTARLYSEAVASAVVGGDKSDRTLPADRTLIVASRGSDGLLCFSPAGPLTRDELDLVTENFNAQCLAGLLPGKAVNVGDTWAIQPAAAQTACLFDGLIKNGLVGKLTAHSSGMATFTIEGTAEGIEHGAKVTLAIAATGTYDTTANRIVALTWKQTDEREQGAIAPASQVDATIVLKRLPLAEVPKDLKDAAIANVPKGEVPAAMTRLRHEDAKGRYSLVYAREWHITGQTDQHLILRLLDKGEFIAQATVVAWQKAEAGKHTPAADFKNAVNNSPGWIVTRVVEAVESQSPDGRWFYRIMAEGKIEELPVVQSFNLIAGPNGDQAVITFSLKPDKVKAVGTRDRELVYAIAFPAK